MVIDRMEPGQSLEGPSVVTIGSFDGLHRGHQRLIRRAEEIAQSTGQRLVVVTFDPHPRVFLGGMGDTACLITPLSLKLSLMESLGVPLVKVLRFDQALADLPPERFLEVELYQRLKARHVVIGQSFTFGKGGRGTPGSLSAWGRAHDVAVEVIEPVTLDDGVVVSSSWIREQIAAGHLGAAHHALAHPFMVEGTVVHGDGRGRTIGFPTANLLVDPQQLMPPFGVYVGQAEWLDQGSVQRWGAVANWGVRPTFNGVEPRWEIHVLQFSGDLTGRTLRFGVLQRLRGEQRFSSAGELVRQIHEDVRQGTDILQQREKVAPDNPPC